MSKHQTGLLKLTSEEYHGNKNVVGHSGLVKITRSPAHFQNYLANPPEPTPAMAFGTAVHAAILEPDIFGTEFVVTPKFDRRTKDGKAAAESWEAENAGKAAVSVDQMVAINSMMSRVSDHAGAAKLLFSGSAELSGFWVDADSGIACKCRPDWLRESDGIPTGIVDVKTCCDASTEGFSRAMATFGYDLQAAFYQDGIKAITGLTLPFYFVAIEKDAPHAVAVYKASDDVIEVGRAKYRGALQLLKWCRENDRWPAYQPNGEIEIINLPRWASNFDLEG